MHSSCRGLLLLRRSTGRTLCLRASNAEARWAQATDGAAAACAELVAAAIGAARGAASVWTVEAVATRAVCGVREFDCGGSIPPIDGRLVWPLLAGDVAR